LIEEA
jgi:hypothetical protein